MVNSWYKENKNRLTINVYVVPRSSKNEIVGIYNDHLKIKLKAQPQNNAANDELIKFLSDVLKIPKSSIEIARGHGQRNKVLNLRGIQRKAFDAIVPLSQDV